jgi:hypothetical protein
VSPTDLAPPGSNPFAALTAVVAPAVPTNAFSVLRLGTSNRLARVVDRTRVAAAALLSVIGSTLALSDWRLGFRAAALTALATGGFTVGGLMYGCTLMVRETRLAVQNLAAEAAFARSHLGGGAPPPHVRP